MSTENEIINIWKTSLYDKRAEFIKYIVETYGENLKHFCDICERGKGDRQGN